MVAHIRLDPLNPGRDDSLWRCVFHSHRPTRLRSRRSSLRPRHLSPIDVHHRIQPTILLQYNRPALQSVRKCLWCPLQPDLAPIAHPVCARSLAVDLDRASDLGHCTCRPTPLRPGSAGAPFRTNRVCSGRCVSLASSHAGRHLVRFSARSLSSACRLDRTVLLRAQGVECFPCEHGARPVDDRGGIVPRRRTRFGLSIVLCLVTQEAAQLGRQQGDARAPLSLGTRERVAGAREGRGAGVESPKSVLLWSLRGFRVLECPWCLGIARCPGSDHYESGPRVRSVELRRAVEDLVHPRALWPRLIPARTVPPRSLFLCPVDGGVACK